MGGEALWRHRAADQITATSSCTNVTVEMRSGTNSPGGGRAAPTGRLEAGADSEDASTHGLDETARPPHDCDYR